MTTVSRRTFLHMTTGAAAAFSATRGSSSRAAGAQRGSVSIALPLATFPYSDVELLDGPMSG